MLTILVAVLHLGQIAIDHASVPEAVTNDCVGDDVSMLQQDAAGGIQNAGVLQNLANLDGGETSSDTDVVSSHGGVPNIIYMTGSYIPHDIVRNNLQFINPGTEFRYFNDEQMEVSTKRISDKLGKVGVHGAYEAFRMLRPMAFRADLWRLMVLWETGGYYLDAKMVLREHISNFVGLNNNGAFAACREDMESSVWTGVSEAYWSGVLAASPRDELVLQMIRLIIQNVQSREYPPESVPGSFLHITGPGVLTRIIQSEKFAPNARCFLEHYEFREEDQSPEEEPRIGARCVMDSGEVLLDSVEKVHADMKTRTDYYRLFYAHAVYCDEPMKIGLARDPCTSKPVTSLLGAKYWSNKFGEGALNNASSPAKEEKPTEGTETPISAMEAKSGMNHARAEVDDKKKEKATKAVPNNAIPTKKSAVPSKAPVMAAKGTVDSNALDGTKQAAAIKELFKTKKLKRMQKKAAARVQRSIESLLDVGS